jgi:endonuclease YncB( thermonuclease family)
MQIKTPCETIPPHYAVLRPRAIDGDTMSCLIMLPLGVAVETIVRLRGFYAPEHHGATPTCAASAQERLQDWLNVHEIHLLSKGSRKDKYGRLCAYILGNGRGADPHHVLGCFQMTEAAHSADLKVAKSGDPKRGATL